MRLTRKQWTGQLRLRLIFICLATAGFLPSFPLATATTAVSRQVYLMGTICAISGEAPDRLAGLQAIEAAYQSMARREDLLSTWRADTALALLNRQPPGKPLAMDRELLGILGRAQEVWRLSGGAFDPAIGRLVEAYDLRGTGRLPEPAELDAARAASGMDLLVLDPAEGTALRRWPGPLLDAGAFGKGEALAQAAEVLEDSDLENWVIDFGGQVLVDPHGEPRAVQVADPGRRDRPVAQLRLPGGMSAATSSGSERPGHILDPRTGLPAADFGSVTVVSRDPLRADAFATALFVLGPEEGLVLARELEDLEALFLIRDAADLRFRRTAGMGAMLTDNRQPQEMPARRPSEPGDDDRDSLPEKGVSP
jgi:thiamine biosynthesis lipoprotein